MAIAPSPAGAYQWGYRPALTQIRFFAVVLVVFFHAGLVGAGYVGVDVFFVLSGFLITNVLVEAVGDGTDRPGQLIWLDFVTARLRRLLPLATVVLAATAIASLVVFDTVDREIVGPNVAGSALWYQNWRLMASQSDYFAPSGVNPFTHYWSLSIEEQFYAVYPLVLLATVGLWRRSALRAVVAVLSVAIIASLAYNLLADATATQLYYSTFARSYQLLAGALLAMALRSGIGAHHLAGEARAGRRRVLIAASLLALTLIAIVNPSVGSAGPLAAASSVVLVMAADSARYRSPLLERLGELSYGVYLWHYPITLYARYELRVSDTTNVVITLLAAHALAWVTNVTVERPARNLRASTIRLAPILIALAIGFAALAGFGDGEADGVADVAATVDAEQPDPDEIVPGEFEYRTWDDLLYITEPVLQCNEDLSVENCTTSTGSGSRVHLGGDSFAMMHYLWMSNAATENDWTYTHTLFAGCPWQIDLYATSDGPDAEKCVAKKEATAELIEEIAPDIMVLTSFPYSRDLGGLSTIDGESVDLERLQQSSVDTIERYTASGIRVVLFQSSPFDPEFDVNLCLRATDDPGECGFSYSDADGPMHRFFSQLEIEGFEYVSINGWTCEGDQCEAVTSGLPSMFDLLHINDQVLSLRREELISIVGAT